MGLSSVLLLLFILTGRGDPVAGPIRILADAPPAPVVSGEIWLIANRWGAYPGILVATIDHGDLHERKGIEFPRYWGQADNYEVLVAISNNPGTPSPPLYEDDAYITITSQYLRGLSGLYLSRPFSPWSSHQLGRNWREALETLGQLSGDSLILPPPMRRTIRLESPDGKPLANVQVLPLMYGSSGNHCGEPAGIGPGDFRTNGRGEVSFVATNSSLALMIEHEYYVPESGGFVAGAPVIVGGGRDITVKLLWKLPQYDYVVWIRGSDHRPIAGAHFMGCANVAGCGYGDCGPLPGAAGAARSNKTGMLRFRSEDLRDMSTFTLVNGTGEKQDLTELEMDELLRTHRLHLGW